MPAPNNQDSIDVSRISVGMKVMGGILVHAVMLVIFFMRLTSNQDKNAEAIIRNSDRISKLESDVTLSAKSIDAQIAAINVRLAVLENNQNAQKTQQHEK